MKQYKLLFLLLVVYQTSFALKPDRKYAYRPENFGVIENFLTLYKNKYRINIVDTEKIFDDISPESRIDYTLGREGYFEIMPYYFKSEGATVCSIIKIA